MPDLVAWLNETGKADAWVGTMYADDGVLSGADRILQRKPDTIIVFARPAGGALPGAQTVRLEPMRQPERYVGEAAVQDRVWIVVLGYKDHPTVADTDLKNGDQFKHEGSVYTVHTVKPLSDILPGHLEAYCWGKR